MARIICICRYLSVLVCIVCTFCIGCMVYIDIRIVVYFLNKETIDVVQQLLLLINSQFSYKFTIQNRLV